MAAFRLAAPAACATANPPTATAMTTAANSSSALLARRFMSAPPGRWFLAAGVYASAMPSVTNVRPSEAISTRSNVVSPSARRHAPQVEGSSEPQHEAGGGQRVAFRAVRADDATVEARSDVAG